MPRKSHALINFYPLDNHYPIQARMSGSDIRDFAAPPHIAALMRVTGSFDLVDPPQVLIDPRLPSGAAGLVLFEYLP